MEIPIEQKKQKEFTQMETEKMQKSVHFEKSFIVVTQRKTSQV